MANQTSTISLKQWASQIEVLKILREKGFVDFQVVDLVDPNQSAENQDAKGRLQDLGFVAGEQGRLLSQAPFGEPLYTEIAETLVALRAIEAEMILVRSELV